MMKQSLGHTPRLILALIALCAAATARADSRALPPPPSPPSYADLADLADKVPLIVRAQVRKLTPLDPARAVSVRPGEARYYIEAKTEAVVFGSTVLGEAQRYLVDLPPGPRGKAPALKKKSVVLFARSVAGRPGELQLITRNAQLPWDAALDARLRAVLAELTAPGAPRRITGVRDALHVAGGLAGEGETQVFLATADGEPAALTVSRAPGRPPQWSVSFSEVVGEAGKAPPRDTLAWYRLACFLPAHLPGRANLAGSPADRDAAAQDYALVMEELGPCQRTRN